MALVLGFTPVKMHGSPSSDVVSTAGSCILLFVSGSHASGSPPGKSDSKSNVWTQVQTGIQVNGFPGSGFLWKNEGGTRGSGHNFSTTATDGTGLVIEVKSNSGGTVSVDVDVAPNSNTNDPSSSSSLTPTVTDFALVAFALSGGDPLSYTAGSSLTKQIEETDAGSWWTCVGGTRFVTGGSGSYSGSWDLGSGGSSIGHLIVALKETAGSGDTLMGQACT